jgi:hypothetical protein
MIPLVLIMMMMSKKLMSQVKVIYVLFMYYNIYLCIYLCIYFFDNIFDNTLIFFFDI